MKVADEIERGYVGGAGSGIAGWLSLMARGGSTVSSTNGSRGEYPFCFVPLIRIQSMQEDTKDQWFLKCPYNVKVRFLGILVY